MKSVPQEEAAPSVLERFVGKARDLYYRADWTTVAVLAAIGVCTVAMFFLVVSVGEYRMSR